MFFLLHTMHHAVLYRGVGKLLVKGHMIDILGFQPIWSLMELLSSVVRQKQPQTIFLNE